MERFARLYIALDAAAGTGTQMEALEVYFRTAPPEDAAWAVYVLMGRPMRRPVSTAELRTWAAEAAGLPRWLLEAAYATVGDLAETLALVLPAPTRPRPRPLHAWIRDVLQRLPEMDGDARQRAVREAWETLDAGERLVWNKLITGGLRAGVSRGLVARALAAAVGIPPAVAAHRLLGDWEPTAEGFQRLTAAGTGDAAASHPYPFCRSSVLGGAPASLGSRGEWCAEWMWSGVRVQAIRRGGGVLLWSRGEEWVTDRFPEIAAAARGLPEGTVVDGAIIAWRDGRPMGLSRLEPRLGPRRPGRRILREVPVILMASDLLEAGGRDLRPQPLVERRAALEAVLAANGDARLCFSGDLPAGDWETLDGLRESARRRGAGGLMLKHRDSPYGDDPRCRQWWKWKADPLSVDAVLLYAQRGRGDRAGLYTDYTFGVWQGEALVPFARAASGLTAEEARQVDRFVRRSTLGRFGPVRAVRAELVFEIAFDAIRVSRRRKAGVAVSAPRIARWLRDKPSREADTLETLTRRLTPENGPVPV